MIIKKINDDQKPHAVFNTGLNSQLLKRHTLCEGNQCGYTSESLQHACLIVPEKRYNMSAYQDDPSEAGSHATDIYIYRSLADVAN